MSGWMLTGRLIAKHFSALGDSVAESIASFDPETATEADRDRLQQALLDATTKLANAKHSFDKEHNEVEQLRTLIKNDEAVAEQLAAKLASGAISEQTVTLFCDELEANKSKLPTEEQQETDAKAYLDQIQQIVDAMSKQLADFDNQAKKAKQAMASAQAQKDLQQLRIDRQNELDGLKAIGGNSSALSALNKKAEQMSIQAEGMKTLADIGQRPLDQAAELDAIRKSVSISAQETPAQRLARLTGKTA